MLHTYPYRETSLIVEAFTRDWGRVAMVARGAKRPRSELRGLLQGFQPLTLSWFGAHELKTLAKAEWRGGLPLVGGAALWCGFYLNELLLKLLPREDPHPQLFDDYEQALVDLAGRQRAGADPAALRGRAARGAGLRAAAAARGRHRRADRSGGALPLRLRPRAAAKRAGGRKRRCRVVRGATLVALSEQRYPDAETAAEAKRLMREMLDHYLEQRGVESRRVMRELRALIGENRKEVSTVIELGVNIDHVATLRQARRTHEPDPVWAAVEAHLGGADGITVHLREDRRHIQDEDVRRLRDLVHIKLNLEMAATAEMVGIACRLKPEMAMLVPEGREEITTEGGLDVAGQEAKLRDSVARLADAGIVTSVFIDAEPRQVDAAARIGARVCEVHTGPYAHAFHALGRDPESAAVVAELERIRAAGAADPAAGHALQRGSRAQLFQRPAGGGAAGRARAAHRPRDRLALGVRRLARGRAADEGAAARSGRASTARRDGAAARPRDARRRGARTDACGSRAACASARPAA